MNVPFYLLKSLTKISKNVQTQREHVDTNMFHHGLIKSLVEAKLRKKGKTWDDFLFWGGFH